MRAWVWRWGWIMVGMLAYALMAVSWADMLALGPMRVAPANLGALLAIGLALTLMVLSGRVPRGQALFYIALLHILVLACGFIAHGTLTGLKHVPRYAAALLAGWALFTAVRINRERFLLDASIAGGVLLTLFLWISASRVGISLPGLIGGYLTTLNRPQFLYDIRLILNAFNPVQGSLEITSSIINLIAAAYLAYGIVVVAYMLDARYRVGLLGWGVAAISLVWVLVLFSSSAMLVAAAASGAVVVVAVRHRPRLASAGAILAGLGLVLLLLSGIGERIIDGLDYLIVSDESSRTTRIQQIEYAMEQLNRDPWTVTLGVGHVLAVNGTYEIHNLFYFSWLAAGVFGLFAVLALYWLQLVVIFDAARHMLAAPRFEAASLVQLSFPMIFLIRTLVGGGGGIPDAIALFPAAIAAALYERKRGREGRKVRVRSSVPLAAADLSDDPPALRSF